MAKVEATVDGEGRGYSRWRRSRLHVDMKRETQSVSSGRDWSGCSNLPLKSQLVSMNLNESRRLIETDRD
jgi:hypothetical protein